MTKSVKRTASRDEAEMVGVQGSAGAEASSHQPRKRCRKAKVVEGSSDQPQERGRKAEVVDDSSDQPKEGGRKAKLPPDEKEARKKARDRNRYKHMKDAVQKNKEMGPQMEILMNKNAELERELGTQKNETKELEILKNKFSEFERELKTQKNETKELRVEMGKLNSELVPAINQHLKTVTEQLQIVKNDNKKWKSLIHSLQSKLTEDDKKNTEIPWDKNYLEGQENRSMVLPSPEHISNGKNLMTNSEYPADFSDLLGGMSKEETLVRFEKAAERHEELIKLIEGINSRLTDIETTIRAKKPNK
ncbi:hypothetical protein SLA2020_221160 [Shorea laevis]